MKENSVFAPIMIIAFDNIAVHNSIDFNTTNRYVCLSEINTVEVP